MTCRFAMQLRIGAILCAAISILCNIDHGTQVNTCPPVDQDAEGSFMQMWSASSTYNSAADISTSSAPAKQEDDDPEDTGFGHELTETDDYAETEEAMLEDVDYEEATSTEEHANETDSSTEEDAAATNASSKGIFAAAAASDDLPKIHDAYTYTCDDCTSIWDATAGNSTCGGMIQNLLNNGTSELDAKVQVSIFEFPEECGSCCSECTPEGANPYDSGAEVRCCDGLEECRDDLTSSYICSSACQESSTTPRRRRRGVEPAAEAASAKPDPITCGDCSSTWDTRAGGSTCGAFINKLIAHGLSPLEAKIEISMVQFPNECGGCCHGCTEENENPYSSGSEVPCCGGLNSCVGDWKRQGLPYYACSSRCRDSTSLPADDDDEKHVPLPLAAETAAAQACGSCAAVWHVDAGDGYSCGQHIQYLRGKGKSDTNAKIQVSHEYPATCGSCCSTCTPLNEEVFKHGVEVPCCKGTEKCLRSGKYWCLSSCSKKSGAATGANSRTNGDSCTSAGHDPYRHGYEKACCDGLNTCLGHWWGTGPASYLCKASCTGTSTRTENGQEPRTVVSCGKPGKSCAAQDGDPCEGSGTCCSGLVTCLGRWNSSNVPSYRCRSTCDTVKILSYNLYWWRLFGQLRGNGGSAGKLVGAAHHEGQPFDFMGFQECSNGWWVLGDAKISDNEFGLLTGGHGKCIAYRKSRWSVLSQGDAWIGVDSCPGHRRRRVGTTNCWGDRSMQWLHVRDAQNRKVLFCNIHGPLQVNSGGATGGRAVAETILKEIKKRMTGANDTVIVVGDFNSQGHTEVVQTLKRSFLKLAYSGRSFGGVDHIFAHPGYGLGRNLGSGGSDHHALELSLML